MTRVGAAAEAYEAYKRSFLDTAAVCRAQGIAFVPLVAESSGGWGASAMCTFKRLARAIAIRTDSDPGRVLSANLATLCSNIRRNNARSLLTRAPEDMRWRPAESALGALAAFADGLDADMDAECSARQQGDEARPA